jgi:hypothetical protein
VRLYYLIRQLNLFLYFAELDLISEDEEDKEEGGEADDVADSDSAFDSDAEAASKQVLPATQPTVWVDEPSFFTAQMSAPPRISSCTAEGYQFDGIEEAVVLLGPGVNYNLHRLRIGCI